MQTIEKKTDARVSSPPPTNRGVENTELDRMAIHWLRGTIDVDVSAVSAFIEQVTGAEVATTHEYGRYFYRKQSILENGITLYHQPSQPNMPQCLIDVTGQVCEKLTFHQLREIASYLKLTRVDIAIDSCPFTPRQLRDAAACGNIRTRSRSMSFHEKINNETGNTFYLGSRQSPRLLRCYDMRDTGTRLEVEMKHDAAEAFKSVLMSDPDAIPAHFLGILRDMVDFVDASSDSNKSRASLLDWWQAFTQNLPHLKMRMYATKERTIETIHTWIQSQCAKSLCMLRMCGISLNQIADSAALRLSDTQRNIVQAYLSP